MTYFKSSFPVHDWGYHSNSGQTWGGQHPGTKDHFKASCDAKNWYIVWEQKALVVRRENGLKGIRILHIVKFNKQHIYIYIYIYIRGSFKKFLASPRKKIHGWTSLQWQHTKIFYKIRKTKWDFFVLVSVWMGPIQRQWWKVCNKLKILVRIRTLQWSSYINLLVCVCWCVCVIYKI